MKTNEKEEQKRINQWLDKLNVYNEGWIDGDKESKNKTADFVNHNLKIAIELKREKGGSLDNKDKNLEILSNRIYGYFEKANKKFASYDNYKSICLIEFTSYLDSVIVVLRGIPNLHLRNGELVGSSIRNIKVFSKTNNIGGFIFWPSPGNLLNKCFYFENPFSTNNRKLNIAEVEKIIGNKLEVPDF